MRAGRTPGGRFFHADRALRTRRAAWPAALAAACVVVLSGCATGPAAPTASGATRGGDVGRAPAAGARRGGFYLDDGPLDAVPVDLDAVPDAVPRREPVLARTARPYEVFGRRYQPMADLEPYRVRGVASWYGRRYHGQRTSSGEVYDMFAMTAAHPTLPIPSYVRVTALRGGRSVVVRINDRGPFLNERLIDLSYVAAHRIGLLAGGSGEVEVELLLPDILGRFQVAGTGMAGIEPAGAMVGSVPLAAVAAGSPQASPPADSPLRLVLSAPQGGAEVAPAGSVAAVAPPVTATGGRWLQIGAFGGREAAEAARERVAGALGWGTDRFVIVSQGGLHKVQAGPFAGDALAGAVDQVARATGTRPFPVTR